MASSGVASSFLRAASGRTSVSPRSSPEEKRPLLPLKIGAASPVSFTPVPKRPAGYGGVDLRRAALHASASMSSTDEASTSSAESRTAGGYPWFLPATNVDHIGHGTGELSQRWGFPWFQRHKIKITQTAVAMYTDALVATGDSTGAIQIWSPTVSLEEALSSGGGGGSGGGGSRSPRKRRDPMSEKEREQLVKARSRSRMLLGHDGAVTALVFRPTDGTLIVSASMDETIRVWYVHPRTTAERTPNQLYKLSHTGVPSGLAWSANGNTVAVGGESKHVVLWDTTPPLLPHSPPEKMVEIAQDPVRGQINSLAFSPSGDRLAVATRGNDLVVWFPHVEAESMAMLPDERLVHADDESGFSRAQRDDFVWKAHRNPWGAGVTKEPDGRLVRSRDWTVTDLGTFVVHELGPRHEFMRPKDGVLRAHTQAIRGVAWSPVDNDLLATVSDDRSAILWNVRTMSARARLEHNCRLRDCAFNVAGTQLLTAGKTMSVWDTATEMRVRTLNWKGMLSVKDDSQSSINELAPSCAFGLHSMVTVARDSGFACMWVDSAERPVERHQIISSFGEGADCKGLWCVSFSPNSLLLATGGLRGRHADINLFCPHSGTALGCKRDAHKGAVWTLMFSNDSKLLVSAGDDGTARLWAVSTVGKPGRQEVNMGGGGGGGGGKRQLARSMSSVNRAGVKGRRHRLLLLLTMRCTARGAVKSAAINATNRFVAAASSTNHTVYVWNVDKAVASVGADGTDESAAPHYQFNPSMGNPTSVSFDPDTPSRLAAAFDQPIVIVWDLSKEGTRNNEKARRVLSFGGHSQLIQCITFIPESSVHTDLLIGSTSDEGETLLWYSKTGFVFQNFDSLGDSPSASQNRCIAFSSDGSLAATVASSDDTGHVVVVWDICSGKVAAVFDGHAAPPTAVAFSPDGHCIASVDEGGALLLHRVSVDGCGNALSTANTIGVLLRGSALRARLTLERNNDVLLDTNISPERFQEAMETPAHLVLSGGAFGGMSSLNSPRRLHASSTLDDMVLISDLEDGEAPTLSQRAHAKLVARKLSAGLEKVVSSHQDSDDFDFWKLEFRKLIRGVFISDDDELAYFRQPSKRCEPAPWASALHMLADATLNGRGPQGQKRLLRQQDLVQAWGELESAAYSPIPNSQGQTPFEVAVLTGNTLFVQTVLRMKGVMDKGAQATDTKSLGEFLTVRDLNALLDTDPGIAAEFLEQSWLLQNAEDWAPQADDNCLSYLFDDADGAVALFLRKTLLGTDADPLVIVGQEYGRDVQSKLWYRHQIMNKQASADALGPDGTRCCGCLCLVATFTRFFESSDIIGAIPEARVLGVDGLSGPGVGRSVLKKLAAFGYATLPAFRSEAMRAVVQHTWVTFGRYAVLGRFILTLLVYVPLHIAVLSRHDEHRHFTLRPDSERRMWQLGWQHQKVPFLTLNDMLASILIGLTLLLVHEEVWYAIIYTPSVHFGDRINLLKLAGPLITIAAVVTKFFSVSHASVLAVSSNLMLWLRVINYFQGIPMFGFMVFLIIESVKDIIPFMTLLFVILAAFSTSLQPWAIKSTESIESNMNTFNTFPEGFFRSFLMLFGDWDMETITDSDFPLLAQILFFAFTIIGPIVMLNIVIAILANTFDQVMESKTEVLLQLQLHETLALEHIFDSYMNCLCPKHRRCCVSFRALWDGRKPRWLHILREVRFPQRFDYRLRNE